MIEFLRQLLNLRRNKKCYGCQILKEQLEKKNLETQMLLDTITSICKPAVIVPSNNVNTGPIKQGRVNWEARKRALQDNARREHEIKLNHPEISEEIEKLEEELGIKDDVNSSPVGDSKPN